MNLELLFLLFLVVKSVFSNSFSFNSYSFSKEAISYPYFITYFYLIIQKELNDFYLKTFTQLHTTMVRIHVLFANSSHFFFSPSDFSELPLPRKKIKFLFYFFSSLRNKIVQNLPKKQEKKLVWPYW